MMMIVQLISLVCRIFYYSKDLEFVIPLPIKTIEILIAKLNTVIVIMYFLEAMFLLIPLVMYGILVTQSLLFFVSVIITLITFPIFFATAISTIMLFIMKLAKYVKNQDKFQLVMVFILTFIITFAGMTYGEQIILKKGPENLNKLQTIDIKVDEINKIFVVINPIIKLLENKNYLINLIKIIIIILIPIILFILLGKKLYLKNILQNKNIKIKNKIINKNKFKLKDKTIEYIKNEIKKILNNPSCFMQLIFQYAFVVFVVIMFLNIFTGTYIDQIKESKLIESMAFDDFKFQSILIVVGTLQLIFIFSNLSITAISREGNNAYFMKYIPMSLYKQFKLKTLPQIFLNTIVIVLILNTIYLKIPEIAFYYYIIAFIIAMILNILNSYIMVLIDLKNPNLNWTNQESIIKNNKNKLYQYVNSIFICLILSYFSNIFKNINFLISIISTITILLIILIGLNIYIKKNINKIFKKIF